MLGEQNPGIDFVHWRVKPLSARKDKSTNAFNLVFELSEKG